MNPAEPLATWAIWLLVNIGIWRTLYWNVTESVSMSLRELSVGTTQKRLARSRASVDTHLRSVVKFCVVQIFEILCVFFFFLSRECFICTVVCGPVSMIVDEPD